MGNIKDFKHKNYKSIKTAKGRKMDNILDNGTISELDELNNRTSEENGESGNKLYKNSDGVLKEFTEEELAEYEQLMAEITENALKQRKSASLDRLARSVKNRFYEKYPLHRQCNIAIFGTEEQREEFRQFHLVEGGRYDDIVERIENCATGEELSALEREEGF